VSAADKAEILRIARRVRAAFAANPEFTDGTAESDLALAFLAGMGLVAALADQMPPPAGSRAGAFLLADPLRRLDEYIAHVEADGAGPGA
jgi:hypothetical protein